MENRVYKCPICGKSYTSLNDMYKCAQACEKKEEDDKIEKAKQTDERDRKAREAGIAELYKELNEAISLYNNESKKKGWGNEYTLILNFSSTKKPKLNYYKKEDSLEDFLTSKLNLEKENKTCETGFDWSDFIDFITK
jgi:hypothetical protein